MPILVYLFEINPVIATAYSLFIVGATSLVGTVPKFRDGFVNLKTALIFGIPSIAAVYATRAFIIPIIPDTLFNIGAFSFTKPILMMTVFGVLMIFASLSMIKENNKDKPELKQTEIKYNYPFIILEGTVVGILTGLVGAGGGFLIIPALVLFSRLPMKMAVGTSLVIIAAKSLIGFTGDLHHLHIDWKLLLTITTLAIVGIFTGNWLSHKIPGNRLKKWFGWFVLVMGVYIIIKELFLPK